MKNLKHVKSCAAELKEKSLIFELFTYFSFMMLHFARVRANGRRRETVLFFSNYDDCINNEAKQGNAII